MAPTASKLMRNYQGCLQVQGFAWASNRIKLHKLVSSLWMSKLPLAASSLRLIVDPHGHREYLSSWYARQGNIHIHRYIDSWCSHSSPNVGCGFLYQFSRGRTGLIPSFQKTCCTQARSWTAWCSGSRHGVQRLLLHGSKFFELTSDQLFCKQVTGSLPDGQGVESGPLINEGRPLHNT
jgi:hypothetical protein